MESSGGKKWLKGCGIGCAGLLVLSISACVSFSVWISRPGVLLEPERLLGSDTRGYVEWTLRPEDPGTAEWVATALEKIGKASNDRPSWLPEGLASVLQNQQRRNNEQQLEQMLPMVAAWMLRDGDDPQHPDHLWTVSMKNFGNRLRLADWIMGIFMPRSDDVEVVVHRDEKLYRVLDDDTDITIFLRGNDVFVTTSVENARIAVDRLLDDGGAEPGPLEALYRSLPPEATLRGAIVNDRGELSGVWDTISRDHANVGSPEMWNAIRAVTISGVLSGDNSLTGTFEFHCPDAEWAQTHAPRLDEALRSGLRVGHVRYETSTLAVGDRIRVDFTIPDLIDQLDAF